MSKYKSCELCFLADGHHRDCQHFPEWASERIAALGARCKELEDRLHTQVTALRQINAEAESKIAALAEENKEQDKMLKEMAVKHDECADSLKDAEQSLRDSAAREAGLRRALEKARAGFSVPVPWITKEFLVAKYEEADATLKSTPSPAADRLKREAKAEAFEEAAQMVPWEYGVPMRSRAKALRALDAGRGGEG